MADAKITALTALAAASADDILPIVDDPAGTPVTKKITVANLFGSFTAFTPTITFSTPGDLNVVYSTRVGRYRQLGSHVFISIAMVTSTFTHTTAAGVLYITGLPLTSANVSGMAWWQASQLSAYTAAGYTQVGFFVTTNTTRLESFATGTGVTASALGPANLPSGTQIAIYINGRYEI